LACLEKLLDLCNAHPAMAGRVANKIPILHDAMCAAIAVKKRVNPKRLLKLKFNNLVAEILFVNYIGKSRNFW
jgi:hypothetical protein